ncbi:Hypothetical protein NTJ_01275 [Nesidiocoris tenuis]|uniref:Uncharacterized protein n=1 Tax=Nesidiocoris tenuis TaxID=355587 RepID=A0ABN7ABH5_9HEMI|nr:Hypothetical protein NTJ_01275 [Nesidiocoris tenuis]
MQILKLVPCYCDERWEDFHSFWRAGGSSLLRRYTQRKLRLDPKLTGYYFCRGWLEVMRLKVKRKRGLGRTTDYAELDESKT